VPDSSKPNVSRRRMLAGLAAAPVILSGCASPMRNVRQSAAADSRDHSVDVIVIGAGAIGCCTAWHLSQRRRKVLVIEGQPAPAMQSTPAAAGFVALWSGIHAPAWGATHWQMQRYGIDFYTNLSKRTRADIGYSPCGICYVYTTPVGWRRMQSKIAVARKFGTTVEVLTKERAKEIVPALEFDALAGVAFNPESIRVRAGDAIREVAREASNHGVRFQYNTRVTDFLRDGPRIAGVRTEDGDIRAKQVIVAAGAWSRPLMKKLGVRCPSIPYNETRYVSRPLLGLNDGMPLLIFTDLHSFYIRAEKGGLLIGGSDTSPLPPDRAVDADNPPATVDLLPPDQAYRFQEYAKQSKKFMPILEHADIASIRSGMPSKTADGNFIAGPVPGIGGLFVMSGCQEAGITHGPALGKILCEYAVDGKTQWDSSIFRADRFAVKTWD
jgi:sarcosine oxidase, subunit beta